MHIPKIMIVEDKAIIALDIMRFLVSQGFKSTSYYLNGEAALRAIQKTKPDLALLDVILHGKITGIEIAEELNRLSIPFIFISALSNPVHHESAVKLHPRAIFIKPVNLDEVLSSVRSILTPPEKETIMSSASSQTN